MKKRIATGSDLRGKRFNTETELGSAAMDEALNEWNSTLDLPQWGDQVSIALRPQPDAPGRLFLQRERLARAALREVRRTANNALHRIAGVTTARPADPREEQERNGLGPVLSTPEDPLQSLRKPLPAQPLSLVTGVLWRQNLLRNLRDHSLPAGPAEHQLREVVSTLQQFSEPPELPDELEDRLMIAIDFERAIGLRRTASAREMGLASLLLGNTPSLDFDMTAAQVIAREAELMGRAMLRAHNYSGLGDFLRRGTFTQSLESID